jgi:hypothetical protein
VAFDLGSRLRRGGAERTVVSALRAAGRVVLWGLVAILLVRGAAGVIAEPQRTAGGPAAERGADPATSAFAVRFARAYLSDPSSPVLRSLLAEGVSPPRVASHRVGVEVAQAEVAGVRDLGDGQAVVTVACELGERRTLYLAVPIVRSRAGEVAVQGVPALVAGPGRAAADVESPRPLVGPEAGAIADLVRRFLPAYLAVGAGRDLSYLLAPGTAVSPPGGGLRLLALAGVQQAGSGEGARRTAIASVRVRDPVSGATYPLAYRIEVVRRGRWYVASVQGALS